MGVDAKEIEHTIKFVSDVLKPFRSVVDHLVRPDRANKVDVLRRAGGHDAGATRLGELDGEMADPARRAMNQDVLPFGQAAMSEQGLPCRQARDRKSVE